MSAKLDISFKGLERLPLEERGFIYEKLTPFLSKIQNLPLCDRLLVLASIFSHQTYGCEEAILSGKTMRYPSEIENQRYCGEQAFVNFLLTHSLEIPSTLVVTQDFKSRGMDHDVVIVPERDHFLMVDWNTVSPVSVRDNKLLDSNSKVLSTRFFALKDKDVFDRIENVRRKLILEALSPLELIAREVTPDGEIEALYNYDKDRKELSFEYTLSTSSTPLSFYYLRRLNQGDILQAGEEAGIISKKQGYKYIRIPLISRKQREFPSISPASNNLSEEERKEIHLSVLYDYKRDNSQSGLIFTDKERKEFLKQLGRTAQTDSSKQNRSFAGRQSEFYYVLSRNHSEESAENYLDALCFKVFFLAHHKADFYKAFVKQTGINSFREVTSEFVGKGLEKIKTGYFDSREGKPTAEETLFHQFTHLTYDFSNLGLFHSL